MPAPRNIPEDLKWMYDDEAHRQFMSHGSSGSPPSSQYNVPIMERIRDFVYGNSEHIPANAILSGEKPFSSLAPEQQGYVMDLINRAAQEDPVLAQAIQRQKYGMGNPAQWGEFVKAALNHIREPKTFAARD